MKEELIIGYPEFDYNILVKWREYPEDGVGWVEIDTDIMNLGFYPIDTKIMIRDSIGIVTDGRTRRGWYPADSTELKMETTVLNVDCNYDEEDIRMVEFEA